VTATETDAYKYGLSLRQIIISKRLKEDMDYAEWRKFRPNFRQSTINETILLL
jgi:hypothetical protein